MSYSRKYQSHYQECITYINCLGLDCSISNALAMKILQSCTKPSIRVTGQLDALFTQAWVHRDNKPRQIGLNHDYNMTFIISPYECKYSLPTSRICSRSKWYNILWHPRQSLSRRPRSILYHTLDTRLINQGADNIEFSWACWIYANLVIHKQNKNYNTLQGNISVWLNFSFIIDLLLFGTTKTMLDTSRYTPYRWLSARLQ